MGRTRNSAWNLTAGLTFAVAVAATSFFATPLLLRWLGPDRLGSYKALTEWVGHLNYIELGLGGAIMAAFAGKIGRDDREGFTKIIATGLRGYFWVMLAQIVAGLALVVALPNLISNTDLNRAELQIAGAVALLPFLLTPLSVFRVLAETRQQSYVNWMLLSVQVLAMTGLSLLMAFRGWGLVGQAAAFTAAQVPTFVFLTWHGTRSYPNVWRAVPDLENRADLRRLRRPTFFHGVAERVVLASDNILIAWILGPAAVVPFFLTQQLAVLAQSHLRGIGQATWAGLAELYSRGDEVRFRSRLLELTGMVSGLGLAILAPIAAYNESFVGIWVGGGNYAGDTLTALGCANALLWSVFSLWGWVLLGAGRITEWVRFGVISAVLSITVSVAATSALGIIGPSLGSAAGLLLVTSWALPRVVGSAFKISPWRLWQAVLLPFSWGLPFAVALHVIARYQQPRGPLTLVVSSAVSAAIGLVLWWRFSLGHTERLAWRSRIRHVFFWD